MAVVIDDFEAVAESSGGSGDGTGKARRTGPVEHAALDRLLRAQRARQLRLWSN